MESKKELAVFLSKLKPFESPDADLEQYPTDSEVAASVLWNAYMDGEIEEVRIADFGCGTGILGIGALALGAKHVTFVELDPRVFPTLMANLYMLEEMTDTKYSNYTIVEGNIAIYDRPVELILQNPPFGTRMEHADMMFLQKAIKLAPIVYSMHKTSTLEHIRKKVEEFNGTIASEEKFDFPLKQTMKHHDSRIKRIDVTVIKITS